MTPADVLPWRTTAQDREQKADKYFTLAERYRTTAKEWAEAEAGASLLEETKSAVLAQLSLAAPATSITGADRLAKAGPEWRAHLVTMVEARRVANLKKVQLKYIEMLFYTRQGADADRRAEMRLST